MPASRSNTSSVQRRNASGSELKCAPSLPQQQFRAGSEQHAAVLQRNVEIQITGLNVKPFHQRTAIHVFIGGDIVRRTALHVHLRRGGERRGARDISSNTGLSGISGTLFRAGRLRSQEEKWRADC